MRKIKLDVSALTVESFSTGSAVAGGTVVGHYVTPNSGCNGGTAQTPDSCGGCTINLSGCNTCGATCPYTCDDATCQSCPVGACGGNLSEAHGTCYNCNTGETQESDAGCATLTT